MVEASTETNLARIQSTVPTACTQTESTVLDTTIQKAWAKFGSFKFNEISPGVVANVEWTDGIAGQLGSMATITYKDGAVWTIRFNELSEKHHRVGYELIASEPSVACTSVQGEI